MQDKVKSKIDICIERNILDVDLTGLRFFTSGNFQCVKLKLQPAGDMYCILGKNILENYKHFYMRCISEQ